MRLLVTNDDGIDSVGLHVLARRMCRLGEVVVVAPDTEYSGASAAFGALHLIQPEVRRAHLDGLDEVWTVNGPPALCVMFARLGVFGPVDLVVSGINPGANVGRSVYHSGTIGAALTARNGGMSGVAISQAVAGFGIEGQGWDEMLAGQRWETAADVAEVVVGGLLSAHPHDDPVVLNVNVPNVETDRIKGWRSTEVGTVPPRALVSARLEAKEGHDGAYYVRMDWGDAVELPIHTDGGAVEADEVSITFLSRLSAHEPSIAPAVHSALHAAYGR
jgi:5'-nucleotidase